MLCGNDDQRRIVDTLGLQFLHDLAQRLIDEVQFRRQAHSRCTQDIRVATRSTTDWIDGELLADADRLKVGAKQRGDADVPGSIMREAVDLIDHRLHMQRVVAHDVGKAIGPAIVHGGVRERYRRATRELRQWHGNRIHVGQRRLRFRSAARGDAAKPQAA